MFWGLGFYVKIDVDLSVPELEKLLKRFPSLCRLGGID